MFKLTVQMNSDDDCPIIYQGYQYCYYTDDLEITLVFDTREECVNHLKTIEVKDGYKASERTKSFIKNFIQSEISYYLDSSVGKEEYHSDVISGNQNYKICIKHITELDPSNKYIGSKIINIRRGHAERQKFIYAELVSAKGELLIGATLDYIYEALNERI